ncbi:MULTISPECIES: organic hydroperoxide resistance protein [unclassified Bartonella]|uniref:organic hydroperoxide resistance protein n=1 Tax=unclassified Bartonella TaxID=2645622 RepID=UPI0015FE4711|nr:MULTISPECIES: organic hydroperoxide resistance protein [unclassified Bartonella]UXN04466.1 organic hydroperoxide resistance protein [Bartonella sp. HY406]UXN07460.1 organic hydroperoxide resistance protein [Bartonella sp. HY761]
MLEKVIYTTSATAKGGREGHVTSQDGAINLDLIKPKEMGGNGKVGANPETLFAAGYAACFESATRFAAAQKGMKIGEDSWVKADVGIGPRKEGGFQLVVTLNVHLDGLDKQQAEMAALTAHNEICPYSHATRGNVEVQIKIV